MHSRDRLRFPIPGSLSDILFLDARSCDYYQ